MSSGETLIKVEGVSKKFCRKLSRSMYYGMIDSGRNMLGIPYHTDKLRKDEFWALKDINFELKRGEVLGLIGKNGSGKSTLLRLLTGIYPPDKGQITMKGRIGALIAVGAGFHQHMTGRENIYLNGVILGMSRAEIKKRYNEIVEFAEIGDFIDAPVATYSSGMKVKLGFAIAININPDILLIDEVLAVGDMGFKMKCINTLNQILENSSVVFVSHSMEFISKISTKIMVLEKSHSALYTNNVSEGIDYYNSLFSETDQILFQKNITVNDFLLQSENEVNDIPIIKYGDKIKYSFNLKIEECIKEVKIRIQIINKELYPILDILNNNKEMIIQNNYKTQSIRFELKNIKFTSGKHFFRISIVNTKQNEVIFKSANITPFIVKSHIISWAGSFLNGNWEINSY